LYKRIRKIVTIPNGIAVNETIPIVLTGRFIGLHLKQSTAFNYIISVIAEAQTPDAAQRVLYAKTNPGNTDFIPVKEQCVDLSEM
jgi:hypothetical protein